ncbi:MAG: hypothetical protein ACTHU0_03165 [Kofleriaceae bacterium]
MHSGYKNDKVKPWKKPKVLVFDDKLEAKTEGDLSYGSMQRARWVAIDLPASGQLDLRLEITPPGEATNEDFDLAMEVLDPGFRVIAKSDLEESDAGELNKTKTLLDLLPGRYYVHLYLQGRMDSADYILRASFKRTTPAEAKSNFPAEVDFVPHLSRVPLSDDAPPGWKGPKTTVVKVIPKNRPPKPKDEPAPPPSSGPISARILNVTVSGGATKITIGRGTSAVPPATQGMKGSIPGVPNGGFVLEACTERACTTTVKATPEQLKGKGNAVLTP